MWHAIDRCYAAFLTMWAMLRSIWTLSGFEPFILPEWTRHMLLVTIIVCPLVAIFFLYHSQLSQRNHDYRRFLVSHMLWYTVSPAMAYVQLQLLKDIKDLNEQDNNMLN